MRLPTWEELEDVEEQLDVLEWPLDKSLFVAGPPGSGKTVLAVHRARMAGEAAVVLTYNRMLRRLMELLYEQNRKDEAAETPVLRGSIATMQSYVWSDYKGRTETEPPTPPCDPYAYNWSDMLSVLEQRGAGPNVPHLVVDEGQDLAEGFFAYASRYISRTLSVFADEDQALAAQGLKLEEIRRAANLPRPILLSENHRNVPEVARLAEHFHSGSLPAASVRRARGGGMPRLLEVPSLDAAAARITVWQTNQGGSTGVIVDQNETGRDLHQALRQKLPESRVDFYNNSLRNEGQINMLDDGVTVLNKESVKGQEFDTVFILELHRFLPCRTDGQRRAMYMMCSRARDDLWLICGPGGRITSAIDDELPGPDIVERL